MPSPDWLPPEVVAAIEADRKIQAIKLLRESTGLGLAEAKQAVEQYARRLQAPEAASTAGPLPPDALQALRNGNRIEAIRLVREHHGSSLRDAMLLVDSVQAREPSAGGSLPPAAPRKRTGLLWLVLLLALAAYAAYRFWGAG